MEAAWGLYILALFLGFTYTGVMSRILVFTRITVFAAIRGACHERHQVLWLCWHGPGGYFGGVLLDRHGDDLWSFSFASGMGVTNLLILLVFAMRIKRANQASNAWPERVIPAIS
ncbi:MAG: hypothetical protein ACI8PP_000466 [Candidatus Pseudothioglobus sp.]